MDLFQKAITVKLSHKDKYLVAEDDQETVSLDRDGSSENAIWSVQSFETERFLRFKSCHGKYLTASESHQVVQSIPKRLDSSTQWEPARDGFSARLRTPTGNFLRPNGGLLPPWRNSVTHDAPPRGTGAQEKVLWDVEVVEAAPRTPSAPASRSPRASRNYSTASFASFTGERTPPPRSPPLSPSPRALRNSTSVASFPQGRTPPPALEPKATKFAAVKHRFMAFTRGEMKLERA